MAGTWLFDHTLVNGLGIGVDETVAHNPTGGNAYGEVQVAGPRNLTGRMNADGTVIGPTYGVRAGDVAFTPVPEPASLAVFAAGPVGLLAARHRP